MAKSKLRLKIRKNILIPLVAAVILAAAGTGYYLWDRNAQKVAAAEQSSKTNTARVRRGSLTLSATGSGTLVAGEKTNLAFPIDGIVSTVNVKVGDTVEEGDVLAELQDTSTLQATYTSAELDLKAAEQELEDLKNSTAKNIADAQLAVADAKEAVADAKEALKQPGVARCDSDTTNAYYAAYMKAKDALDALGDGGGNQDYYLNTIVPAKNEVAQAYSTYMYCAGFTEYEISSSHANLALAEAELEEAQDKLQTLQDNDGIDPTDLSDAQNKVSNAKVAYEKAKKNLEHATLTAPFDGTILSVEGEAGDEVEAGTFITIADLRHPDVEFSVDETDMEMVSAEADAEVVFDAIPDTIFKGKVTRVNPSLVNSNGVQVLQGVIQLELDDTSSQSDLFIEGLTATVDIIKGSVEDALLVPVEAVHDLGDDQYGVFVVGDDGEPRLKVVEIGLSDATYVEIKSGVEENDVVTTGTVETN